MALGAEGVQIGTLFALSAESSAHEDFKQYSLQLQEGDTRLALKQLSPTRLVKSKFLDQVLAAETAGASVEELKALLGKGRAKKGMFEGNLEEGELELGQIVSSIRSIKNVEEIMKELVEGYHTAVAQLTRTL